MDGWNLSRLEFQDSSKVKVGIVNTAVLFLLGLSACSPESKHEFQYVSPEAKGFSSERFEHLTSLLQSSGSSAMMILVDGEVIYDWGETKRKHVVHSIRKALLNSLYGIYISRGIIDTSLTLRALHIDDIEPHLSENELDAKLTEILKSRSGVYHNAAGVSKGMLQGKPPRDAYRPGEHFYYNNWDFNVLGAILEKETKQSIYELFYHEIAKPVGMHDYRGKYRSIDGESEDAEIPRTDGFYQFERSKSNYPAYHFRMSARDLALYGQLYLENGNWDGKQLIPGEWIDYSIKPYSIYNKEHDIGYGVMWYVRGNSFYHTGLGMHMLAVYPDDHMVVVHRVDTENDFNFYHGDLLKMIDLIFDAKIK